MPGGETEQDVSMAYSQNLSASEAQNIGGPDGNPDAPPGEETAKPHDPTMPDEVEFEEGSAAHDGIERKIDNR